MKVKAKKKGYYGIRLIEPGVQFDLSSDKHFSASWMENVEPAKPEAPAKPAKS